MKFIVIAVGKLKERFWTEACAEYLKRLQPYVKTEVREIADVDPRRAGGVEGARDKEGAAICAELDKLGPDVHVALLAIDGKERSSVGISQRIDSLALAGKSSFAFVIGGPMSCCRSARSPCPTTWRASCSWSSSTARRRSRTASPTTSRRPAAGRRPAVCRTQVPRSA